LERVNPSDGALALEHGYAVTIYQAQGATLDSAYVMADPAMDRQEFYVAASRTREETFFYATPEVGFDRIEIAPSPPDANALEHIARAAERDGAQAAAHDAALRERLGRLSTDELFARRRELASEAGAEARGEGDIEYRQEQLAEAKDRLSEVVQRREELGEEPPVWARSDRAAYREELARIETRERSVAETAADLEADIAKLPAVEYGVRTERAVAEHLIEERLGQRLAAVRFAPPDYIVRELGERPSDPAKRQTWDRAVAGIESYRHEHGLGDRDSTHGPRPEDRLAQLEHHRAMESLRRSRRNLGREQARTAQRTVEMGIEM
jgi:hypothetical protein